MREISEIDMEIVQGTTSILDASVTLWRDVPKAISTKKDWVLYSSYLLSNLSVISYDVPPRCYNRQESWEMF